jgi:3'-5' exoribonuclease
MNRLGIKEYKIGEIFTGFCIIRKRELKYKQDGEPYLFLELGDNSGRLRAKFWKDGHKYFKKLKVNQIIKVKGKIHLYMDTKELHIEQLRLANDKEIDKEDLIPTSKKDLSSLYENFKIHQKTITNEFLHDLLNHIFINEQKIWAYLKSPSGKLWHHNYLYGILEHTVCLLDLSDVLCKHYPEVNKDLLKTGILLYHIGKLDEVSYNSYIEYTDEGRLLGHSTIGYYKVREVINQISNFPEELKIQLLHILLSHEGSYENGAAVLPMTLEAIILSLLIQLDVQTNATTRIIKNDSQPDSNWTTYNNLFKRFMYVNNTAEKSK